MGQPSLSVPIDVGALVAAATIRRVHRWVGLLLLVLACALVAAGGFVLADAISFANGCRDECHAAGYWGARGLLLLCVGLLVFVVSMLVLTTERRDDEAERHDRWLRELQLRLPRD